MRKIFLVLVAVLLFACDGIVIPYQPISKVGDVLTVTLEEGDEWHIFMTDFSVSVEIERYYDDNTSLLFEERYNCGEVKHVHILGDACYW